MSLPVFWNKFGNDTESANSEIGTTLTKSGTPTYNTGIWGNGLEGAANAGWVFTGSNIWATTSRGAFGIWWLPAVGFSSADNYIVMSWNTADFTSLFRYYVSNGGSTLTFEMRSNSVYYLQHNLNTSDFSAGEKYYIHVCWDENGINGSSDTGRVYINGQLKINSTTAYTSETMPTSAQSRFANYGIGNNYPLVGVEDNCKCYGYAKVIHNDRYFCGNGVPRIRS